MTAGNVLRAFSIDHASRVTGLTKTRLTRWDRLGLFSPELVGDGDAGNPYSRVYSYADLVGLRTLGVLTDVHHVSLNEIRRAYDELIKQWERPWSEIRLGVLKRKIVIDIDDQPRNVTDGQLALKHIPIPSIADEIRAKAQALRTRDATVIGKIEQHKFVARNAHVFAGTRIPVSAVREFIDEGFSDVAIVKEYPTLKLQDIRAARRWKQAA